MPFISYDPIDAIRKVIGTSIYNPKEKQTTYVFQISDTYGKIWNIPMLLSEDCRRGSLPEMPYIKMHRAMATYVPHDVKAAVRRMTAYIDLKLYFQDIKGINPVDFKQLVLNALQNNVRLYQESITGSYFIEITEERDQEEVEGSQVTFIYIVTLKCNKSDAC
jgi:hypothetical protein